MAFLASCATSSEIKYPQAPTDENVSDTYFDLTVADRFRPLENDTSAETKAWVDAENKVTSEYLSQIPFRESIRKRLNTLFDYPKHGIPSKKSEWYYFYENDGLKNQSVLYRTKDLNGTPEVFLDPNTLSEDGTVALTGISQSNDGKYTAYTISRNGSDWTEIYVMDTESKKLLDDHIEWAKFTGADWHGDGFFYSAYPRPEAGKEFSNANENHQIYYHKIGTPQSQDKLVYEDPAHPLHFHSAYVPEGSDYLFVLGGGEGFGESLMLKNLANPSAQWLVAEPSQQYSISPVGMMDGKLLLLTNYGAERNRLMALDPAKPQRENWTEVVPEKEGVLSSVSLTPQGMILTYQQDAADRLVVTDRKGNTTSEIKLPTLGTVGTVSSSKKHPDVFYTFTSFTYPSSVFSYNLADGTSNLISTPEIEGVNLDDYVTEQVFYPSADGTKIPMFLTYKKGLERNGKNPVYLYGYGGFNISLPPSFSANRLLWLENGGIYAQANLRGGNVFNDFIAAAEYLINENWTSPEHIAIEGGSNGGLLVGATVNLRPDLFKVAIPRVGVMDMMRYHLFTIGWNWASDYGTSADSPEMAKYLLDYSPLHTIRDDGTPYPAIMVTTADHDDRVVPAHSFKYAATLQASDTGDAPKLIRIDSKAGHGAGKPIAKVIDEQTDIYSFIFENLGMKPQVR